MLGTVLILLIPVAFAAPNFIGNSRVTGDSANASIEIHFNCQVTVLDHTPRKQGDHLRIRIEPTTICNGVSPYAVQSNGRYRPVNSDRAALIDFEYQGSAAGSPVLVLKFSEIVSYTIDSRALTFRLTVNVQRDLAAVETPRKKPSISHRQVLRPKPAAPIFVINLASLQRIPTAADLGGLPIATGQRLFYSKVIVEGQAWYRLRLGDFDSTDSARTALSSVVESFPDAWIDQISVRATAVDLTAAAAEVLAELSGESASSTAAEMSSRIDSLMSEARLTMVSGNRSRAIQIYTKILQLPEHPRQMEAQEFLALARERQGQSAHAKAEYQRYLSLYPDGEGAARVRQRLAALLAVDRQTGTQNRSNGRRAGGDRGNSWRLQTFFSQYYRRDVNQPNDREETVSQSALYSDMNFDARRRGERYDFSSRLTIGHRNDFLAGQTGGGNDSRITYAYADLADADSGFRGRIGRQSRNSGGVLGRFDGINVGYQATERMLLNTVLGRPTSSANNSIDSERTFYGLSIDYGPLWDGLELGLFLMHQEIGGISDRQSIGAEFRYFGSSKSVWGHLDYDTGYSKLSSAFLQTSWRVSPRITLNGSLDQRHTPFLTAGNAIIGQPVSHFSELTVIFDETEIRQLGLDRSPLSMSYSLGMSFTLSPRWQISADANRTSIDATPASGGILETPETRYTYFAANVIAGSLLREGDVTIISLRQSNSVTAKVVSMSVDSRYPINRTWRLNPRLRVDRRERMGEADYEWIYTPGIRIQYRRNQKLRIEFEAGKQFAQRDTELLNLDRESYFVNLGYQVFF